MLLLLQICSNHKTSIVIFQKKTIVVFAILFKQKIGFPFSQNHLLFLQTCSNKKHKATNQNNVKQIEMCSILFRKIVCFKFKFCVFQFSFKIVYHNCRSNTYIHTYICTYTYPYIYIYYVHCVGCIHSLQQTRPSLLNLVRSTY